MYLPGTNKLIHWLHGSKISNSDGTYYFINILWLSGPVSLGTEEYVIYDRAMSLSLGVPDRQGQHENRRTGLY